MLESERTNHGASQTERYSCSGVALLSEQPEKHCRDQRVQAEAGGAVHYGEGALCGVGEGGEVLLWWWWRRRRGFARPARWCGL